MTAGLPRTALLLLVTGFAGCGGSDPAAPETTPEPLPPEEPGLPTGPAAGVTVSFNHDVLPLFEQIGCTNSGCHGRPAIKADLDMSSPEIAWRTMVDVVAQGEPQNTVVIPGDAQNSYLVIKLEDRQSFGLRMPWQRDPMTTEQIAIVRAWIDEGAWFN